MTMGKKYRMAGTALAAVLASGGTAWAQASNADLQARVEALEAEVQQSEMNAAQAANNPPPLPTGWWSNTLDQRPDVFRCHQHHKQE